MLMNNCLQIISDAYSLPAPQSKDIHPLHMAGWGGHEEYTRYVNMFGGVDILWAGIKEQPKISNSDLLVHLGILALCLHLQL